jgi:hypothetical protein
MKNPCISELTAAMAAMTEALSIQHVFDDSLSVRGGGTVRYALQIDEQFYLAWHDDDTAVIVVSPLYLWDVNNLLETIDDPLAVLSIRRIDGAAFEKIIKKNNCQVKGDLTVKSRAIASIGVKKHTIES